MSCPEDDRGGEAGKGLAEAFRFLLSNDPCTIRPASRPHPAKETADDGLLWLLSIARQNSSTDQELLRLLCGKGDHGSVSARDRIEKSQQAFLILDENRFICCCSAGARRLMALGQETNGQLFNYYFQPGKSLLINIERADRTVGVGTLLAVETRWEGRDAYLVTVRDVTPRLRDRLAARSLSAIE